MKWCEPSWRAWKIVINNPKVPPKDLDIERIITNAAKKVVNHYPKNQSLSFAFLVHLHPILTDFCDMMWRKLTPNSFAKIEVLDDEYPPEKVDTIIKVLQKLKRVAAQLGGEISELATTPSGEHPRKAKKSPKKAQGATIEEIPDDPEENKQEEEEKEGKEKQGKTGKSGEKKKQCTQCGVSDTKLLQCSKCRKVQFCSRECQLANWKAGHKEQCK